jgi:uncharacterized membrane protein
MFWLALGVLLWSGAHLFPSLGASTRSAWIERAGEDKYKGGFSLVLVVALALMVLGWRATAPVPVYAPPLWGPSVAIPLMALALLLFVASGVSTNVKRVLRHPQLTGVATWSAAHLVSNGDGRSLLLFGGLGLWAVVEMLCLNRRDGAWQKPEAVPLRAELRPLIAAVVAFALLYFAHPYIAGVPVPVR